MQRVYRSDVRRGNKIPQKSNLISRSGKKEDRWGPGDMSSWQDAGNMERDLPQAERHLQWTMTVRLLKDVVWFSKHV